MFRAFVALLFVTIIAGKNASLNPFTPQGRIIGGNPAAIEEHPWQVSLQLNGLHFCGGSIISDRIILTAAHCTVGLSTSSISVRVGSSSTLKGGRLYQVTTIQRHERFRTNMYGVPINDLAILRLAGAIKFSATSQPIRLFDENETIAEGTAARISGWGALRENGITSDILYTVDVPIVAKRECSKAYASYGGLPAGQICAAYPQGGKDTCQGDSGGPLVIAGRQAGIVSWGNGCARKGYPGVYTEIASYRGWIVERAKD